MGAGERFAVELYDVDARLEDGVGLTGGLYLPHASRGEALSRLEAAMGGQADRDVGLLYEAGRVVAIAIRKRKEVLLIEPDYRFHLPVATPEVRDG